MWRAELQRCDKASSNRTKSSAPAFVQKRPMYKQSMWRQPPRLSGEPQRAVEAATHERAHRAAASCVPSFGSVNDRVRLANPIRGDGIHQPDGAGGVRV